MDKSSFVRGDVFEPLGPPGFRPRRIRGMLQVRDAVREVFRTQLADADDRNIVEARHHLNRTYDFFVSRFGPLNARENVKAFAGDPDQPLLLSLEEFNPETKRAQPRRRSSSAARWSAIARLSVSKPRPKRCSYRSMKPARSTGRAWRR